MMNTKKEETASSTPCNTLADEASQTKVTEDFGNNGDDHNNHDDSDVIPEEFVCPLTLEIFTDPLMDRRGMNFERDAIVEWLNRGNLTCPLTREPLGYRSLIPNFNLRARVEHWKREHGYQVVSLRRQNHKFVGLIEAPVDSRVELVWTQGYMAERAREIIRRVELQQQQQEQQAVVTDHTSTGRRRRRGMGGRTGNSPTTQQRQLTGLLGEALNIVRRPPLVTAEES
jgi:hypothetical protein